MLAMFQALYIHPSNLYTWRCYLQLRWNYSQVCPLMYLVHNELSLSQKNQKEKPFCQINYVFGLPPNQPNCQLEGKDFQQSSGGCHLGKVCVLGNCESFPVEHD